ncbi:hypothetical protein HOLDEFILI_03648 [Holdemania filiformis DSM 12042]|uniref:Uncharacterized protein n=1 Tax=Holdemania filiformis DSM 12042 TaxID=545696 RepID=B9YCT7_9FIRM|nr:hypothetical protein HOLDEFILI_03648 [Holdemania filiformis DSM 12042]
MDGDENAHRLFYCLSAVILKTWTCGPVFWTWMIPHQREKSWTELPAAF